MKPRCKIVLIAFSLFLFNIEKSLSQISFYPNTLKENLWNPGQMAIADMDNDGDWDFVSCARDGSWNNSNLNWFQNDGNTPPSFQMYGIAEIDNSVTSISTDDVNGDNYMDIIVGNTAGIFVLIHDGNALPNFDKVTLMDFDNYSRAYSVASRDIDSDGDIDVLVASIKGMVGPNNIMDYDGRISWWENEDGAGVVFTEHLLEAGLDFPQEVYPFDFDMDGNIDIFGMTSGLEDDIIWYRNSGMNDSVAFEKIIVEHSFQGAESLSVCDLDGDGDNDIVGAGDCWYEVHWWEFNDGDFIRHSIKDEFTGANWVHTVDLDLDGDIDVLGAAEFEGIHWWENDGSSPPAFEEHVLTSTSSLAVVAFNLDDEPTLEILGGIRTDSGYGEIVMWDQEIINSNSENKKKYEFRLYPNPMKNTENVQVEVGEDIISGQVFIFNQLGSFISKRKINNNSFNTAGLPAGIYIAKIELGKKVVTEKIVVY